MWGESNKTHVSEVCLRLMVRTWCFEPKAQHTNKQVFMARGEHAGIHRYRSTSYAPMSRNDLIPGCSIKVNLSSLDQFVLARSRFDGVQSKLLLISSTWPLTSHPLGATNQIIIFSRLSGYLVSPSKDNNRHIANLLCHKCDKVSKMGTCATMPLVITTGFGYGSQFVNQ